MNVFRSHLKLTIPESLVLTGPEGVLAKWEELADRYGLEDDAVLINLCFILILTMLSLTLN